MAYDYEVLADARTGLVHRQTGPAKVVPGLFTRPRASRPERFGLVDAHDDWRALEAEMKRLRSSAPPGVLYKLILFNRHGQGVRNVAAKRYSYDDWLERVSSLPARV